jgi:hypothetical protein
MEDTVRADRDMRTHNCRELLPHILPKILPLEPSNGILLLNPPKGNRAPITWCFARRP